MSYLLQMREFLQDVAERNYDARYIYRLEDKSYNWRQRGGESQIGSRRSKKIFRNRKEIPTPIRSTEGR